MRRHILFVLLLLGITLACFWPVGRLGFTGYDDWDYVTHNPMVRVGFSLDGLVWAFTSGAASNWHPLTWLSHMLDCQLFGLNPAEQHWMNLGLHAVNTLLLFALLRQLTGARWRSFLVAGLFAIHPLHVQSVAWIAERKDVLSGFFGLLTLICYARWSAPAPGAVFRAPAENFVRTDKTDACAERPTDKAPDARARPATPEAGALPRPQTPDPRRDFLFWTSVGLFALGLMAKPMLVTLPLVMLLLDYWPLGRVGARVHDPQQVRTQRDDPSSLPPVVGNAEVRRLTEPRSGETPDAGARPAAPGAGALPKQGVRVHPSSFLIHNFFPLVLEKTPFFLLCLASCLVTLWAQGKGQAVVPLQLISWPERWLHADLSYSLYLGKLFWPADLAIFYPFTRLDPENLVVLLLLPLLVTIFCLWLGRARPYLLAGWCWFVIMLIPVIGFVQVGIQWMADRYTYLPAIGLFIAAAWAMGDIAATSKSWRAVMAVAGAGLLTACGLDTRHQLGFWRNDVTLFQHVVDVTPENNFAGYFYLGNSHLEQGDLDAAAESYARAVDLLPGFYEAQTRLGGILLTQKKYAEAEVEYREILKRRPRDGAAHKFLGIALSKQERDAEAQAEFETAKGLIPDDPRLGALLATTAQRVTAEQTLAGLTNQWPAGATPEIQVRMAEIESFLGNYPAAVGHYQSALALKADALDALNTLAWLLATCPEAKLRDGPRAVQLADQACKLSGFNLTVLVGTLAAAQAEAGRFDDAIATAQKACASASAHGETNLLQANQNLLKLYQQHQAWHEPARSGPTAPPSSVCRGAAVKARP